MDRAAAWWWARVPLALLPRQARFVGLFVVANVSLLVEAVQRRCCVGSFGHSFFLRRKPRLPCQLCSPLGGATFFEVNPCATHPACSMDTIDVHSSRSPCVYHARRSAKARRKAVSYQLYDMFGNAKCAICFLVPYFPPPPLANRPWRCLNMCTGYTCLSIFLTSANSRVCMCVLTPVVLMRTCIPFTPTPSLDLKTSRCSKRPVACKAATIAAAAWCTSGARRGGAGITTTTARRASDRALERPGLPVGHSVSCSSSENYLSLPFRQQQLRRVSLQASPRGSRRLLRAGSGRGR